MGKVILYNQCIYHWQNRKRGQLWVITSINTSRLLSCFHCIQFLKTLRSWICFMSFQTCQYRTLLPFPPILSQASAFIKETPWRLSRHKFLQSWLNSVWTRQPHKLFYPPFCNPILLRDFQLKAKLSRLQSEIIKNFKLFCPLKE